MSSSRVFNCIVDDTALITNISEIEAWVSRGVVSLVIPLHTLERLNLLKKDSSQIGQNARKAVKFLDDVTSNAETENRIAIQGPDDSYSTWEEVETHYNEIKAASGPMRENEKAFVEVRENDYRHAMKNDFNSDVDQHLSQVMQGQLNISKPQHTSPTSTPPLSPSSSGLQSTKTSPEVKTITITTGDVSPVPQTLKPLMNPVVWYTYEKKAENTASTVIYLTNSSDNSYLARDFGVASKNIHQLRAAIGLEEQEAKNHNKYQKKHGHTSKITSEPRTLFRYDEDESDDEELVFKPRSRGTPRNVMTSRGGNTGSVRSRKSHGHSPANSLSTPSAPTPATPQIPIEEIDPDSFDRGSFGRGNTPLVTVGNNQNNQNNQTASSTHHTRSSGPRGGVTNGGPSRGANRGGSRGGFDRGNTRGRGRLFVP